MLCTGTVTLSPMTVAPVCRVGDPLELTCTAHVEFLRWNIQRASDQMDLINGEIINSRDLIQMRNVSLNSESATITLKRISAQGASPQITIDYLLTQLALV
jgi:hypothetical protein